MHIIRQLANAVSRNDMFWYQHVDIHTVCNVTFYYLCCFQLHIAINVCILHYTAAFYPYAFSSIGLLSRMLFPDLTNPTVLQKSFRWSTSRIIHTYIHKEYLYSALRNEKSLRLRSNSNVFSFCLNTRIDRSGRRTSGEGRSTVKDRQPRSLCHRSCCEPAGRSAYWSKVKYLVFI